MLNVGGYRYTTTRSTLSKYPESMLGAMFSGRHKLIRDSNGCYFIDSDGENFRHILSFLRHETLPPSDLCELVYKDALYYGIDRLVERLQMTASVAQLLVREAHRAQYPEYAALKQKLIRIAIDNAAVDKVGCHLVCSCNPFIVLRPIVMEGDTLRYLPLSHEVTDFFFSLCRLGR